MLLVGALIALIVVAAMFLPLPKPVEIRDWALAAGPFFALAFFLAHAVLVALPIPRTVFTLSAGLLFGPVTGLIVAISASAVAATIAFVAVRRMGRDKVADKLTHPAVAAVDRRLAQRGWLAVGSLRLIGAVPYSIVNYCAALSSIRYWPFIIASVIGLAPGTFGVVVLGDALTGHVKPGLLIFSLSCAAIGVVGLLVDTKLTVDKPTDVIDGSQAPRLDLSKSGQ